MKIAGDFVSRLCSVFLLSAITVGCHSAEYQCSDLEAGVGMPNMAEFYGIDEKVSSQALDEYSKKIETGSVKAGRGYYCLGKAFYDAGDNEKALAFFGKSIDEDGKSYMPYFSRARVSAENGQCSQAIDDYTYLLDHGFRRNELLLLRASAFIECDDPERASSDLQEYERLVGARQRDDRYYKVLSELGLGSPNDGKYAEEISYFQREVEQYSALSPCTSDMSYCSMPRLVSAVDNLTAALCKAGYVERASEVFEAYQKYRDPAPRQPSCLGGNSAQVE